MGNREENMLRAAKQLSTRCRHPVHQITRRQQSSAKEVHEKAKREGRDKKLPEGYTFEKSAAEGATAYGKVQGSKMLAMTWGLICLAGIGFYFRTKDSSKENK